MQKRILILPFIIAVAMLNSCTNSTKVANPIVTTEGVSDSSAIVVYPLIVPGMSVGQIALNQDAATAVEILGKADAGDAAMQKSVATWYNNHNPKSYSISIFSARDTGDDPVSRIRQIRTTDPQYKTTNGIGVTSTLLEIQRALPVTDLLGYTRAGKTVKVYDSLDGISFEMNDDVCTAIIIHPRGENLSMNYLPFS